MKKFLGILVLGLLLSGNAYAYTLKEYSEGKYKKPWYKKLKMPGISYFEKRKECKEGADRADTVHMGKIYYKNCMDD